MGERTLKVIVGVLFIGIVLGGLCSSTVSADVLYQYNGPDTSSDGLQLTSFEITGPYPLRLGDEISVKFDLKNTTSETIYFGEHGILVQCRNPKGENEDFGHHFQRYNLFSGRTAHFTARKKLDQIGVWTFWPAYYLGSAPWVTHRSGWGPYKWHAAQLKVYPIVRPDYEEHLLKIKNAGVGWVRIDEDVELAKFARQIGLNVIFIVKSKDALKGKGWPCENYVWPCDWGKIWKDHVKRRVRELKPWGVKVWQVGNELNHNVHNPLPSLNIGLSKDIVKIGAKAIRSIDRDATITVNVYAHLPNAVSFIKAYKELRNGDVPIHILGMDYYRGTWATGSPSDYPSDLTYARRLWGGDLMIMETGFCTRAPGHNEAKQRYHVEEVFNSLDSYLKNKSWFRGIVWYSFKSKDRDSIPPWDCEGSFGLHHESDEGISEKPAWKEFVKKVQQYKQYGKMLGTTCRR